MSTPINTLELEGRRYAVVPVELLVKYAPQLLEPYVPDEGTPWEVVKRTIEEDVSKIRAWREYLHLSQEEVAARMGVSQASLSQTEAAKRPRKATLEKVAKALGITLEQLRG